MTSCSSVSVLKSTDQRSKSSDTVCSSNNGCFLQKRKPVHPLAASLRANYPHTNSKNNNVRQRVLSAKLLKLRSLQSQINDANFHLVELQRENQALRTLNQRQEKALAKYEHTDADLPRLLKSHSEEVRVLTEKNKTLRRTVRDLTDLVKNRDEELILVRRQLDHLEKLNKNKHLGERQKLSEQIEELKQKIDTAERQISTLNRKLLLEGKTSKQKLSMENVKHKQCQKNLMQALAEIERLTGLVDVNNINTNKKELPLRKKVNNNVTERESKMSLAGNKTEKPPDTSGNISLCETQSDESLFKELPMEAITEKFKLNNISNTKTETESLLNSNGEIISPTENVRARLTSSEKRSENSRPESSSQKFDRLSTSIDSIIQKSKENGMTQFDRTLGDYCNHVMSTVKNCSKIVEDHQESLDQSRNDTETLKDAIDEIKALDDQLKRNSIFSIDANELRKLLKPEKLEKNNTKQNNKVKDKNGNVENGRKKNDDNPKAKLLATLRAIDNGNYIDNYGNESDNNNKGKNGFYDNFTN